MKVLAALATFVGTVFAYSSHGGGGSIGIPILSGGFGSSGSSANAAAQSTSFGKASFSHLI